MKTPCPECAAPAEQDRANRWRPFCSERCKMIDLSKWLDGSYVVPGPPADPGQPGTADEEGSAIQREQGP
jgi:endogenous inhibitor of DNA gyrase (YacG/DUF329 family)